MGRFVELAFEVALRRLPKKYRNPDRRTVRAVLLSLSSNYPTVGEVKALLLKEMEKDNGNDQSSDEISGSNG